MALGQQPPLPVQALVHVEDVQVGQRDAGSLTIRQGLVPARRAARDDRAGRPAGRVVGRDQVNEFAGHHLAHLGRVLHQSEKRTCSRGWPTRSPAGMRHHSSGLLVRTWSLIRPLGAKVEELVDLGEGVEE